MTPELTLPGWACLVPVWITAIVCGTVLLRDYLRDKP